MKSSFALLLAVSLLKIAYLQQDSAPRSGTGSCPRLTTADIGNTTALSTEGLVAEFINPAGDVPAGDRTELVRIMESMFVCEASGTMRDEISSVSFVVRYQTCPRSNCLPNNVQVRTEQFQFDCIASSNTFGEKLFGLATRTETPSVDLSSALLEQCGECTEPDGFTSGFIRDTHCRGCHEDCTGSGRCLGSTSAAQCCNYYLNGRCVQDCGSDLVPDPNTFDCVTFRCEELPMDPTYTTTYSNNTYPEGSTASQSCNGDGGFVVSSGSTETNIRTCTRNGWSGTDIVCERFACKTSDLVTPPNGAVTISPQPSGEDNYIGAVATFTCKDGFNLSKDVTRTCVLNTGWDGTTPECDLKPTVASTTVATGDPGSSSSSCSTGCIVGIVLAVLGAIILSAILAGVAYAVYSYMNHPDTKLAKYDPDNINGVAKDNPLYVDPEAVVGDGAEAA